MLLKTLLVNALLFGASYAASDCSCDASITPRNGNGVKWTDSYDDQTRTIHDIAIKNNGPCDLTDVSVSINIPTGCEISSGWNLENGYQRVVSFGGNLGAGSSFTGSGIIVACSSPETPQITISITSTTCNSDCSSSNTPTSSPTPITPTDAPITPTDAPITPTDAPITPTLIPNADYIGPVYNYAFAVFFSPYNGTVGIAFQSDLTDFENSVDKVGKARCSSNNTNVGCEAILNREFEKKYNVCISVYVSHKTGQSGDRTYVAAVGARTNLTAAQSDAQSACQCQVAALGVDLSVDPSLSSCEEVVSTCTNDDADLSATLQPPSDGIAVDVPLGTLPSPFYYSVSYDTEQKNGSYGFSYDQSSDAATDLSEDLCKEGNYRHESCFEKANIAVPQCTAVRPCIAIARTPLNSLPSAYDKNLFGIGYALTLEEAKNEALAECESEHVRKFPDITCEIVDYDCSGDTFSDE